MKNNMDHPKHTTIILNVSFLVNKLETRSRVNVSIQFFVSGFFQSKCLLKTEICNKGRKFDSQYFMAKIGFINNIFVDDSTCIKERILYNCRMWAFATARKNIYLYQKNPGSKEWLVLPNAIESQKM